MDNATDNKNNLHRRENAPLSEVTWGSKFLLDFVSYDILCLSFSKITPCVKYSKCANVVGTAHLVQKATSFRSTKLSECSLKCSFNCCAQNGSLHSLGKVSYPKDFRVSGKSSSAETETVPREDRQVKLITEMIPLRRLLYGSELW